MSYSQGDRMVWRDPCDGSLWAACPAPSDHGAVEFWRSVDGGAIWTGPVHVAQIVASARGALVPYRSRPTPGDSD